LAVFHIYMSKNNCLSMAKKYKVNSSGQKDTGVIIILNLKMIRKPLVLYALDCKPLNIQIHLDTVANAKYTVCEAFAVFNTTTCGRNVRVIEFFFV